MSGSLEQHEDKPFSVFPHHNETMCQSSKSFSLQNAPDSRAIISNLAGARTEGRVMWEKRSQNVVLIRRKDSAGRHQFQRSFADGPKSKVGSTGTSQYMI